MLKSTPHADVKLIFRFKGNNQRLFLYTICAVKVALVLYVLLLIESQELSLSTMY